jgi:hypothetical protein
MESEWETEVAMRLGQVAALRVRSTGRRVTFITRVKKRKFS